MMDPKQLSGDNMEPRTAPYGIPVTTEIPISAFNLASPEERARMISAIPKKEKLNYKRPMGPKKTKKTSNTRTISSISKRTCDTCRKNTFSNKSNSKSSNSNCCISK